MTELAVVAPTLPDDSDSGVSSTNAVVCRTFEFGEFFSGMGGYSRTMEELAKDRVNVHSPLDGYDGWNILTDEGFSEGERLCSMLDHGHFAPPCRTLTRARRSDEHGVVKQLRSDEHPEGWGAPEAEEANKIVAAMVWLILLLVKRGRTFAVENPWDSYLWALKIMIKILRLPGVELVLLHQCAYGSVTPKPTGILTNAAWMKKVCLMCWQVRKHYHLKGGLVGKAWSYHDDRLVWRTSLAAEYPCGLTIAWSRSLLSWLKTDEGTKWMLHHSFKRVGRWGNTLVRACDIRPQAEGSDEAGKETAMEKRERENKQAVGGLRFAKRAVSRSKSLRDTGKRIRSVLDRCLTNEVVQESMQDISKGVREEVLVQVRKELCREFGASEEMHNKWPVDLWRKMLQSAGDPEQVVLPQWMMQGFPLGIKSEIEHTGVFPQTFEDTASVEASRLEGTVLHDELGEHSNYKSFTDAGEKAQVLLDQMVDDGRAEVAYSWQEVTEQLGEDARLTKMGCIVKTKEDLTEKVRLVFDGRKSGVNGEIHCRERVTLPRISDVADGYLQLLALNHGRADGKYPKLFSTDFRDAFYMLNLRPDERSYVVMKGLTDVNGQDKYYMSSVVVFGLATGPLLWSRVAACAMRVSQSVLKAEECDVHCFVDDPLIVSMAESEQQHMKQFLYYAMVWLSLGLQISWKKTSKGTSLQWIGFQLSILQDEARSLQVELAPAKATKLLTTFEELEACRGMVPLQLLQYAVGVLGWLSSAIPMSRPWLAMLWAVITQQKDPVKQTTRRRKGLVFVKQINNALRWLKALLTLGDTAHNLCKIHRWLPEQRAILVQTDASPFGLGGVCGVGGQLIAFYTDHLWQEDFQLFGSVRGDPAFQTEYEMLAVLVALRVFRGVMLQSNANLIVLRCDNTAVLSAAFTYKASSPILAQLTAEIALELESMNMRHLIPQHVPGVLNRIADKLSRPHVEQIPAELSDCLQCPVPRRPNSFYRAWPVE